MGKTAKSLRLPSVAIFLVLLGVYLSNGDLLPGNDATPNTRMAVTLLEQGRLTFTPETHPFMFRWMLVDKGELRRAEFQSWDARINQYTASELRDRRELHSPQPKYYLIRTKRPGVFANAYGPAAGLFALPVVAAARVFTGPLSSRPFVLWHLAKLAASLCVAGSAIFVFLAAAHRLRIRDAVILALVYGLCTCVWSMSSQTLWQHGPATLCLAAGMYALSRRDAAFSPWLAGVAFALAFLCRPTNGVVAILAGLWLLPHPRRLARYLASAAPFAVAYIAYNLRVFGEPIVLGQLRMQTERFGDQVEVVSRNLALLEGLAGVWISPSRGMLVFSPILAVAVVGMVFAFRRAEWKDLRFSAVAALCLVLVGGGWFGWGGGWCYGYRIVVDAMPFFALCSLPCVQAIAHRRWLLAVCSVAAGWSLLVQVLGAYSYDVIGWNNRRAIEVTQLGKPVPSYVETESEADRLLRQTGGRKSPVHMNVDSGRFHGRLWKLRDSQILYYLLNPRVSRARKQAYARRNILVSG